MLQNSVYVGSRYGLVVKLMTAQPVAPLNPWAIMGQQGAGGSTWLALSHLFSAFLVLGP